MNNIKRAVESINQIDEDNLSLRIEQIKTHHRRRRNAIKFQQKLDRALESLVRVNFTDWKPDADEKSRKKANLEVMRLIKEARNGEGKIPGIVEFVKSVDAGRSPFDEIRDDADRQIKKLAKGLPTAAWIQANPGTDLPGLATIIAETGDLSNYPNVAKVWKRLGFAPYHGLACSTWKRESWRPRALTSEEWTEAAFASHRYAMMYQIALWLVNKQWIGAKKVAEETGIDIDDAEGRPNGRYGEVYYKRRQHTKITHPEWTDGHSRMDGIRIAMKAFLADLWAQWHQEVSATKQAAE